MEKDANKSRKGQKAGSAVWTERERRKEMKNKFSLHELLPQLPAKANRCDIVDEAVRYIKSLENTLQTAQKRSLTTFGSRASSSITSKTEARTDIGCTREVIMAAHFEEEEDQLSNKFASGIYNPSHTSLDSQQASCFKTWFSPNVVLNICGNEAHISVCSPRRPGPGLLSTVFCILEKHKLDVLSAHISSDQHRCLYMIHAQYAGGACDDTLVDPAGALSVEDTFNLAAGELTLCLFSS